MIHTVPEQKLPQVKKTKDWYKQNVEAACYLTRSDSSYLNTWRNQVENFNLSLGILDESSLQMQIDSACLGMETYPVKLKHIGIGNSKLNILIGDYLGRKSSFRASISNRDEDGITTKETNLKTELFAKLTSIVQQGLESKEITEDYYKQKVEEIQSWMKYEYQDIRENVINQLLNYYYLQDDFLLKFTQGFATLLNQGKVAYWIDDFGGKPEIRRPNPLTITTIGGNTPFIHEKDWIIVSEYKSPGQIYDDYWNELTEEDRKKVENLIRNVSPMNSLSMLQSGSFDNSNIHDVVPIDNYDLDHFGEAVPFSSNFSGTTVMNQTVRSNRNELLVSTVFWKTRRKILKLESIDPKTGIANAIDFVSEGYIPDKSLGETVKTLWVNEWCRGTKIAYDIYVNCGVVKSSAKSMTNLSSGLPPIIGLELDRSVYDTIKELDKSYDVTYWKRAMLIASYEGTKTAVNLSMVPEGIDPKIWLHMSKIDNIIMLDPTREVLKGPATGKIAGNMSNNFITQEVKLGANHDGINMLTQQLADLEYTMGMICGIPKERMGDVGERQAVRNTQFEIQQFQKATEMIFKLEENVRRIVLKKFVEVIKIFHRDNPIAGSYFLNDLSQTFLESCNEIAECEYDISISNSAEDTKLQARLEQAIDASIAQGKGNISNIITMASSGSLQKLAAKLKEGEQQEAQQEQALQKQAEEAQKELRAMELQESQNKRDHELQLKQMDLEIKKYDIDQRTMVALNTQENNQEPELIDDNETDLVDLALREKALNETIRHNKTKEKLDAEKNSISRIQKKKAPSTK